LTNISVLREKIGLPPWVQFRTKLTKNKFISVTANDEKELIIDEILQKDDIYVLVGERPKENDDIFDDDNKKKEERYKIFKARAEIGTRNLKWLRNENGYDYLLYPQ